MTITEGQWKHSDFDMWHVRSLVAEHQKLAKGGLCGCLMSLVQRLLIITLSAESMHWHKNKGCGGGGGGRKGRLQPPIYVLPMSGALIHVNLLVFSIIFNYSFRMLIIIDVYIL